MKNFLLMAWVMVGTYGCAGMPSGDGLSAVLPEGAQVELVQEGFQFTEGPLGTSDGGLFFTDLGKPSRIFRLDAIGGIAPYVESTQRANGLAYMRNGAMVSVEGDGKRVIRIEKNGTLSEVTRGDGEKPLLQPNDLIADSKGGLYFTDPGPRPIVPGRKVYVYYLPPGATRAVAVDDMMVRPSGLTLTPDERTLIVADTVQHDLIAFDVQPDGRLTNRRAWAGLRGVKEGQDSGAYGMAIDRAGRVFVTSVTGVQVFDPGGNYLGTIAIPRRPANVAFAGPGKSILYITAGEGLYRVRTYTRGPDRLGK
jgi:gluconolactonase